LAAAAQQRPHTGREITAQIRQFQNQPRLLQRLALAVLVGIVRRLQLVDQAAAAVVTKATSLQPAALELRVKVTTAVTVLIKLAPTPLVAAAVEQGLLAQTARTQTAARVVRVLRLQERHTQAVEAAAVTQRAAAVVLAAVLLAALLTQTAEPEPLTQAAVAVEAAAVQFAEQPAVLAVLASLSCATLILIQPQRPRRDRQRLRYPVGIEPINLPALDQLLGSLWRILHNLTKTTSLSESSLLLMTSLWMSMVRSRSKKALSFANCCLAQKPDGCKRATTTSFDTAMRLSAAHTTNPVTLLSMRSRFHHGYLMKLPWIGMHLFHTRQTKNRTVGMNPRFRG
jgi:hypothetical protein